MHTAKIDTEGRWMRADAAESYARMRLAGMPAGGIVTAGRTRAQQQALYEAYKAGRGNLAAPPGTSLHERGTAMDVTRKTAAQLWLAVGGDPMKVRPGENLRAHRFGWSRTVRSEAWHFTYDPARDRYRDGLPTLRFGSRDAWFVAALQRALGITRTTSTFGPTTRRLLREWQTAHGLTPDGICGPLTWAALGL